MRIFELPLVSLAVTGFTGIALLVAILRRRSVRRTTLISAWWWTIVALGCWLTACAVSLFPISIDSRSTDAVWYLAGVMTACPGIAVMGARRPVAGVWSAFVVLPLVLVLSMPLFSAWQFDKGRFGWIVLETPMLLGFCLVAVMGSGNYVGTRFTIPALLAGASTLLVATTFRSPGSSELVKDHRGMAAFFLGALLVSAAVLLAAIRTRKNAKHTPATSSHSVEHLWREFVGTFGIVWAKRVGERVNRAAEEERLPARIDLSGLVWTGDSVTEDQKAHARSRLEQTLRRLLKRFVDPEWIEERTRGEEATVEESETRTQEV